MGKTPAKASVLKNLLKKDGFVIIPESNGLNPFLQLTLLKQRGIKTIKTYTNSNGLEKMFGIERITRKSSLIKYFTSKGFHKLSSRYYRVLPNNINLRSFTFLEYLSTKLFPFIFIHYNVANGSDVLIFINDFYFYLYIIFYDLKKIKIKL